MAFEIVSLIMFVLGLCIGAFIVDWCFYDLYEERIEELSKLHQPTVISSVCEHNFVPSIREAKVHTCVKCNCQRVEIAN